MSIFKGKTVSGTGHRFKLNKKPYESEVVIEITKQQLKEIGTTKVITGMALGFDTFLALAALELGITLVCAMPYKGFGDWWCEEDREVRDIILSKANSVVYVSEGEHSNRKLQIRNEYLVDNCHELIAFYHFGRKGGTYNCLRYAESKGKRVHNIYPKYTLR